MVIKKLLFITLLFLASCKSTTKTVTEYRDRDVYHEVVKLDSIFKHDSVFVSVFVNGDSVFVTNDRWHYLYKYLYIYDTTSVRDTAFINKEIVKEKKVTRMFSYFDLFLLIIVTIAFALWLRYGKNK